MRLDLEEKRTVCQMDTGYGVRLENYPEKSCF